MREYPSDLIGLLHVGSIPREDESKIKPLFEDVVNTDEFAIDPRARNSTQWLWQALTLMRLDDWVNYGNFRSLVVEIMDNAESWVAARDWSMESSRK